MKYLKNDDEVRILRTQEQLDEYLAFRKENDEWYEPFIRECSVVGINNDPLFIPQYLQENGIEQDESSLECIEDLGLFLAFPKNGKMAIEPTRVCAFPTLCQRAGLSGQTITNFETTKTKHILPLKEKAAWLTRGMSLYDIRCKILYRDEKISAVLSKSYEILPAWELIGLLENNLRASHPDFTFRVGEVSHEYLSVEYLLNDPDVDEPFLQLFKKFGLTYKRVKAGVGFATSDIGLSRVYAYPFLQIDGMKVRLSKAVGVRHDKGNGVDDFKKQLPTLAKLFDDSEDRIEKLGNTPIANVGNCLTNVLAEHVLFPKDMVAQLADECRLSGPDGTAVDVYIAISDLLERYRTAKNIGPTTYLSLMDRVVALMYLDFTSFDKEA